MCILPSFDDGPSWNRIRILQRFLSEIQESTGDSLKVPYRPVLTGLGQTRNGGRSDSVNPT